jgi:16S rRNA (guanine527-N7)-methyltransferase
MDSLKMWTICASNGIVLDKEQVEMLERYANELVYWNDKVNMISRKDTENVFERHILHSLSILKYIQPKKKAKCLDIGTGGGLPGIPIKIAHPDIYMTMIDSIGKKVKMTDMFAKHTELRNISAKKIRAEDLAKDLKNRKHYDLIFSRAVARISKLVEWSKNMLKDDGKYILLKGGELSEEIKEAKNEFRSLNIKEIQIDLMGAEWFNHENKKLLICSFDKQ